MESPITIITFYKFFKLLDYSTYKIKVQEFCIQQKIKGTILLSHEGINGTVAGTNSSINNLISFFNTNENLRDLNYKFSDHECYPFKHLKVKIREEIVTLGISGIDPATQNGTYVDPKDWNQLITDPDTLTIDTRNDYEVAIGHFKDAINPKTNNFRQFPEYFTKNFSNLNVNKKIAMYCTGGIRCEKSTAYLKSLGFNNVFHLKGGILAYLANIPKEQSLWEGECFVFDDRICVDHQLNPGSYKMCYGCRRPISLEDQKKPEYKQGIHCHYCINSISIKTIQRATERQKQINLAKNKVTKVNCL